MVLVEKELSFILNEFVQKLRENSKPKFRFLSKKIKVQLLVKYKEAIPKVALQKSKAKVEILNKTLLKLSGLNLVLQGNIGFEDSDESLVGSSDEESVVSLEKSDHLIESDIEYATESDPEWHKLDDIPEESEDEIENQDDKQDSFDCHICEKVFKKRIYLKRHLETHNRRFKCKRCGDEFKTFLDLQVHRHVHAHEKSFKCDFCGIGFKVEHNMKEHRRIHTGEKYKCDICDKQFTQMSGLHSHKKTHTDDGSRPFECDKKFKTAGQLKQHGLVHSAERPYDCDICFKKYKHPQCLRWRFPFLLLKYLIRTES